MGRLTFPITRARAEISAFAKSLGFDLVGFTRAEVEEKYKQAFREWIAMKREAGMAYMSDTTRIEHRFDMTKTLSGAASVVMVAMNYYHPQSELKPDEGRIARYAYGRDYHKIFSKKLKALSNFIRACGKKYFPAMGTKTRSFVDIGPVMERALAEQAGIGFIGKNSLLITKEFGSWVLLGEVITTIPLTFEGLVEKWDAVRKSQIDATPTSPFSSCGSCTRCIQSCPTGAIIAPGVVDASRCISYLTIEHKGEIPDPFKKVIKETKRIFGCDICQEVCPHNSRQKTTTHDEFTTPAIAQDALSLKMIHSINTDVQFHERFAGSALKRAKRMGLKRNAQVVLGSLDSVTRV